MSTSSRQISFTSHERGIARLGLLALLVLILVEPATLTARDGTPPLSRSQNTLSAQSIAQLVLPAVNPKTEIEDDVKLDRLEPLRFAVPQKVGVNPATHGTWEQLPNGRLWRLRVLSPGATDLNFGFTNFWLPPGATLHFYSESEDYVQGPYTEMDNQSHGQLWTPVLPGESAVIELFMPSETKESARLDLGQVGLGYRDVFKRRKDLGIPKAGSCNIDVVCPQGDPWRNDIRSVARYSINGSGFCTGTLVVNARGDFKNYFLTANHCGIDTASAATVVVYWNFESPACGQHGGGSLSQNQSGATFRAAKTDVDFCLIELNQTPSSAFQVYYAGWDRSGVAPAGCVGIHHPNADEKSISFCSTTLATVSSCIGSGGSSTHWQVVWDQGVTEPGSSGSGIWTPDTHLLVGTLSGGDSSCGAPAGPDCYGKLSIAWDSGTSPSTRLRDWLDPQDTGVLSMPGMDSQPIIAAGSTLLSENCPSANGVVDPFETVTVNLSLGNFGKASTTNLIGTLQPGGGVAAPSAPQDYGAVNTNGSAVARSFTFTALGNCGDTITATLLLQDGTKDMGKLVFSFPMGQLGGAYTQNFDGISAPALPSGWTTSASGVQSVWTTSTVLKDTPPNAAFSPDPSNVGVNELVSPAIAIPSGSSQLSFRHNYNLESGSGVGFDGGVLEISIGGGAFTDILDAGGSFAAGGYTRTISSSYDNPLSGRQAWSGSSGGFITTSVDLPPAAAGQNIQLKWRCATDSSVSRTGWYVDTLTLSARICCDVTPVQPALLDPQSSNDVFAFTLSGDVGRNYVIEAADLPPNWTPVATVSNATGTVPFSESISTTVSNRFYRARLAP